MRKHGILLAPVVSEKSFRLAAAGQYSFVIDPTATASDVGHAVERLYDVSVTGVRTLSVRGKRTRSKGIAGRRVNWKKALVTVKTGQRIAGFEVTEASKADQAAGQTETGQPIVAEEKPRAATKQAEAR